MDDLNPTVYALGHIVATYDAGGTRFQLDDAQGSRRVQANADGTAGLSCFSYPYGDGLSCSGPDEDATEQHFTGKEYDPESGNYYFGARYDADSYGRFLTPDQVGNDTHTANPQSWNLYTYGRNNPLRFVDPTGTSTAEADFSLMESLGNLAVSYALQDDTGNKAQQQTEQLNVNGTHFTVTTSSKPSDPSMKGMTITITPSAGNCSNCKWIQTVNVNGHAQTDYARRFGSGVDPAPILGNTSGQPNGQNIRYDSPDFFPSTMNGSKYMVSTFGTTSGGSFHVGGSITWGFSVSGGNVNVMTPRQSTPAEQRGSLAIIRSQYPKFSLVP